MNPLFCVRSKLSITTKAQRLVGFNNIRWTHDLLGWNTNV